ncbi:ArgS-related anticodon-binding protein NrtL [Streptomyces sp. NPDC054841]
MTPADLSRTVQGAVRRAVEEGAITAPVPERVKVERSRPGGSGDYATNAALRLAREARMPALRVAEVLSETLAQHPGIAGVEITGPGFLNITLAVGTRHALVREVLAQGNRYGHGRGMAGQVHQYHHRSEVRAAVTTDAVRRLLQAQGALVRTSCDEEADPDWARLRVTVGAEGTPPVSLTGPRPVPAGAGAGAGADAVELRSVSAGAHADDLRSVSADVGAEGTPPAPLTELRPVPAGARAGELLRRFGPDATRWALLRPAGHDRPRLDDGLLVQGESNPLFRVRYAHSRSRALIRAAAQLGISPGYVEDVDAPVLVTALGDHPAVLESAARLRAPDRVARHLEATADAFLAFQHTALPVGDEKPSAAHRSRLALAEAAGTVLAGGLALLGISAPEHL